MQDERVLLPTTRFSKEYKECDYKVWLQSHDQNIAERKTAVVSVC